MPKIFLEKRCWVLTFSAIPCEIWAENVDKYFAIKDNLGEYEKIGAKEATLGRFFELTGITVSCIDKASMKHVLL